MQPQPENNEKKIYLGVLRSDIEVLPGEQDSDGMPSWLIFDPVSDKYYRIPEETYRIISQMNRVYELNEFCERLNILGIHTTPEKVMETNNLLVQSNLCAATYMTTEKVITKQQQMKRKAKAQRMLSGYLFFRIPLLRPDRFLDKSKEFVVAIFNPFTIGFLVLIASIGYVALVMNWHKLADAFIQSLTIQGLARYSIAVIFIKCIHELAHAYAAKLSGIRVRRMGIAFIIFFPRLYTDLTDAWRINQRRRRFLIDGAGIISELVIGGWAALIWANSAPGATKSVAYYIFAVSIINTVLVNGNPFIRYDGYYMLMDVAGIDNLQQRGIAQFKYLYRRIFFGIEGDPPAAGKWRRILLVLYGISCFVYRLFLYTSIILIVYYKFTKVVGILMFLVEVHVLVIKPISMEVKFLRMKKKMIKKKHFIWSVSGFSALLLVLLIPLPWNVDMPCEVKPVKSSMIYIQTRGFLDRLHVDSGTKVHQGSVLLTGKNPFLKWNYKQTEIDCQVKRVELDHLESSQKTLAASKVKLKELELDKNRLVELQRKNSLLNITSPINGTFQLYDRHLTPGKWLQKGAIIGEVFAPGAVRIEAFMSEEEYKDINVGDKVSISLTGEISAIPGKVMTVSPIPARLPPSPLLNIFGGPIICFPGSGPLYQPLSSYYRIIISTNSERRLPIGRTGTVSIRKFSSVGGSFLRKVLHTLQRELTP
jgi:putative peptide zinc metalloprotease protein